MNKKGLLAGALTDFYAYILFVFVFIIFLLLFFFIAERPESQNLTSDMRSLDASISTLNVLRMPVEDGRTMADLIIEAQAFDFEDRENALTDDVITMKFVRLLEPDQRVELEILYPDSNEKIEIIYGLGQQETGSVSWPKTVSFPSVKEGLIKVRMTFRK